MKAKEFLTKLRDLLDDDSEGLKENAEVPEKKGSVENAVDSDMASKIEAMKKENQELIAKLEASKNAAERSFEGRAMGGIEESPEDVLKRDVRKMLAGSGMDPF